MELLALLGIATIYLTAVLMFINSILENSSDIDRQD